MRGFTASFLRLTEPMIFGRQRTTLIVVGLTTLVLAWQASLLRIDAGYEKQLPIGHEHTEVFKRYQGTFGGATRVLIGITQKQGDIYELPYLETLRKATEQVFFVAGVDRTTVTSLFTPNVAFAEAREQGTIVSGSIVPAEYAPTPEMVEVIRGNVRNSRIFGRILSQDQRAGLIWLELLERDPASDARLDYLRVAAELEEVRARIEQPQVRVYRLAEAFGGLPAGHEVARRYAEPPGHFLAFEARFLDAEQQLQVLPVPERLLAMTREPNRDHNAGVDVHIVGFAKSIGDIAGSAAQVASFFGIALLLTLALLWIYCGSLRVAVLPMACAVVAVIWELGLLRLAGFGLDPYAMLVPFLILALGASHGVQITSFWLHEVAEHAREPFDAALATYRRLVIPGLTALLTNIAGFATLALIPAEFLREIAINACFGCLGVVVGKKVLLPILLSRTRLPDPAAFRAAQRRRDAVLDRAWSALSQLARPAPAAVLVVLGVALYGWAEWQARSLVIGDTQPGAPELRPDSRYNRDSAAIDRLFSGHREVTFIAYAESKPDSCIDYATMEAVDRFGWQMQNVEGVVAVRSLPRVAAFVNGFFYEDNPKFSVLPRAQGLLVTATTGASPRNGLTTSDCATIPVYVMLRDQKADTLQRVLDAARTLRAELPAEPRLHIALASGNAGMMAAANEVVRDTERPMLLWVYLAIAVCVWLSFRSMKAVVCILAPLALVSVLAYAVMAHLGLGLKITTLPIAAFAAGIGVDYGIYIYSVLEEQLARGQSLPEAYRQTLHQTGKAVIFTGLALTAGVATWIGSGLQFQVDMGILLAIMFLTSMAGTVLLLPALAAVLDRAATIGRRLTDARSRS